MTRNVIDNAILFQSIVGGDATDPSSVIKKGNDYSAEIGKDIRGKKIGILPDILFRKDQPDVIEAVKRAMISFQELGAEIVECHIEHLDLMQKAWYVVCSSEAASVHYKNIREQARNYGPDVRTLLLAGNFVSGSTYVQAQRYRRWLRMQFEKCFQDVDMFLFPTLPTTAVTLGEYDIEINGKMENMLPLSCEYVCYAPSTGLPALQLPCGLDHDGMPIGMKLLGRAFDEKTLYRVGAAFETVFNLASQLPGLNA